MPKDIPQVGPLSGGRSVADGRFLSIDMIGRNGHMRWPETLAFVEAIWSVIEKKKKYNHQFKETHEPFLNFDCSGYGFEGIRSQDILPLLVPRFAFNKFFGMAGIVDVFIDRSSGAGVHENHVHDMLITRESPNYQSSV